jgi:predicted nuclease of predicted toxin-antitoxin system
MEITEKFTQLETYRHTNSVNRQNFSLVTRITAIQHRKKGPAMLIPQWKKQAQDLKEAEALAYQLQKAPDPELARAAANFLHKNTALKRFHTPPNSQTLVQVHYQTKPPRPCTDWHICITASRESARIFTLDQDFTIFGLTLKNPEMCRVLTSTQITERASIPKFQETLRAHLPRLSA